MYSVHYVFISKKYWYDLYIEPYPGWPLFFLYRLGGGAVVLHMILNQLFKQNRMEKDLSPSDLYKGVTEDSVFHVFELVMTHHQL